MEGFHKNLGHEPKLKDFKRTSQGIGEWRGFTRIWAMTRNGKILKGPHRE